MDLGGVHVAAAAAALTLGAVVLVSRVAQERLNRT